MQVIHGRETKIREAVKKLENGEKIDLTQFYVGVHGKFIVEVVKALAYDTKQAACHRKNDRSSQESSR